MTKEYIERGALLEKLKEHHDYVMQDPAITKLVKWREAICYGRHKNLVEQAPAADVVEVKHGRWRLEISPERNATLKCTECDYIAPHELDVHRYCPNCGAKMDGE